LWTIADTKKYVNTTRANPTIASYNASAVKISNATSRLVRFENKDISIYLKKHTSLLQFQSRRIGSRP
jgi:hypothetical protein